MKDRREKRRMIGLIRRKASWLSSNLVGGRRGLCLGGALPHGGAMEDLISQLQSHVQKVLAGGGPEAVKRNLSRNKLLPRQRIDRLLDPGSSFLELSQVLIWVLINVFIIHLGLWKVHYLKYYLL